MKARRLNRAWFSGRPPRGLASNDGFDTVCCSQIMSDAFGILRQPQCYTYLKTYIYVDIYMAEWLVRGQGPDKVVRLGWWCPIGGGFL